MATLKVEESLITTKQAANIAKCGVDVIVKAINAGELKAFRPGGRKLIIFRPDLSDWMKTHARKAQAPAPELFIPLDNSRNVEIANQAADLMVQAKRLMATAQELLAEIA